jgi:hypothetical protein
MSFDEIFDLDITMQLDARLYTRAGMLVNIPTHC